MVKIPKWARWAISIGLLALLTTQINPSQFLGALVGADLFWVGLGLLTMLFLTVYSAFKWWLLLPRGTVSLATFVRINFISNFVGVFLPGIVGIEVARVAGLASNTKDLPAATASVIVDRAFGLLSLGVMVLIGISMSPIELPWQIAAWAAGLMVMLVVGFAMLMHQYSQYAAKQNTRPFD